MRHAIRRGVCAIIERHDGEVLLHLRSRTAWVYPDCWAFISGGVEKGESPYAAFRRESLEELGSPIHGHKLFSVAWHTKGGRRILDHTFYVRWRSRPIHLREGQRVGWFSIEEALAMPHTKLPPHERFDLSKLQRLREMHGRISLAA